MAWRVGPNADPHSRPEVTVSIEGALLAGDPKEGRHDLVRIGFVREGSTPGWTGIDRPRGRVGSAPAFLCHPFNQAG
jgi:hypothetical protein